MEDICEKNRRHCCGGIELYSIVWRFTRQKRYPRTDTKRLSDERQLALGTNFNTKLSQFDNGTGFFTFLVTLFGLALGSVDNGNTRQRVAIFAAGGLASFFLGWHDGLIGGDSNSFTLLLFSRYRQKEGIKWCNLLSPILLWKTRAVKLTIVYCTSIFQFWSGWVSGILPMVNYEHKNGTLRVKFWFQ